VVRGETVESVHRGHMVVIDGEGQRIASAGDPEVVTFFRSACKPFQTMPLLVSGAADAFGFDESEVALACASHSGQRRHTEIAASMLNKIGMSESDLRCGSHLPFYQEAADRLIRAGEAPTQLHNNCSGKHAAMLAVAKHIGADTGTYEQLENPVQQQILSVISKFTGVPPADIAVGIDGCAAPNFAVSLQAMARSFIGLVARRDSFTRDLSDASARIVRSMLNHPELIGGTGRLDTMIMQAAPDKVLSKVGADGVWLAGVLPGERWPSGLAIALKIEDGDDQLARPVVAVELLRRLDILRSADLPEISPMPIKNRRGDDVGQIRPTLDL
jgi:L-asparaginase II